MVLLKRRSMKAFWVESGKKPIALAARESCYPGPGTGLQDCE